MFGFVKMAALSAVLSYGVVNAYGPVATAAESTSTKIFHDRVLPAGEMMAAAQPAVQITGSVRSASAGTKSDRLPKAGACEAQTWPYLSEDCVQREGTAAPKRVRVITVESREGANVSVLARVRQADLAQR
jgi:hypothetical protein